MSQQTPVPLRDGPATVLVVDDTPANVRLLRAYLTAAGHQVVTASDGAAALRTLASNPCDLVLCDVSMPDMDGFEVCRAIKQAPATRDIPVVLLTAADDDVQRERALKAGADDYVVKPVEKAAVLALVKALLRIGRLKQQVDQMEGVVVSLARAVDDRDGRSPGLSERVAYWAMQLGSAIGLPEDELNLLYKAALLHDVGTLAVPAAILAKRGSLEPSELSQVRRHPAVAEEILGPLPRADQLLPAIRHHHERIDGAGYPDSLTGESIPIFSRIIAIADAYVALTSDRPYRARVSRAEALKILREHAGKQWDASLVERFLPLVESTGTESVADARSTG